MDASAAVTLVAESTLTDRYQTTVPDPIRRVLKLGKRDRLRYTVLTDSTVVVERAEEQGTDDPVLGSFLEFLAQDLAAHPERLQGFDKQLLDRVEALVGHVGVDLDAALSPDDE
jgi:antitoxin PrlF